MVKTIDEQSISVIAEESDDLLALRRVIKPDDRIAGSTTRVIKRDKEYSRPDRGERVRVKVALDVVSLSLDNVLDKLRIRGVISESSSESVPHGSHHSMLVETGDPITITKRSWSGHEKKLIRPGGGAGFVLIAVDTGECGVARLDGTHLKTMPNLYSGSSGKMYKSDFKIEGFLGKIAGAASEAASDDAAVIIFGPGQTKKRLANYLEGSAAWAGREIRVTEGIDSGGEDGIHTFTKSATMREIMAGSKLARVSAIVDCVMSMASKKSRKFSMGYIETRNANDAGAVESLVFSDKAIQDADEQEMVDFLNDVEGRGAELFGVDSTTDAGLRVTGLGGMIAVLRFPFG